MIGALLDQRYRVVRVLGHGGFGRTYIAEDTRRPGNPTCVVKHLKPASNDPDFLKTARRLFTREAETLEKLGAHDQIPRLLAYFEENHEFYLVQELIEGHPLNTELAPGQKWAESQVIQLLQEVLPILEFVHGNSVIHRDLKPENLIRRTQDNKIVLVDFGAVKEVQMQSVIAQQMTNQTVAIGTPGYMPSEQGQGRPRPSSDIYALGMICIQALTGMNPTQFSEDPDTGEILWLQYAEVNNLLASMLSKMVRHYFKYRYQSASEALQSLDPLTNPHSPHAIATITKQRMRYYLQGGYQSASKALQTIQNLSASGARQAISTLKSLPSGQQKAASVNLLEETVTIPPSSPSQPLSPSSSVPRFPNKLTLIIGASTVVLVITAVILSATRQPSPSVVANGNKTNLKTEPNKSNSAPDPDKSTKPEPTKSNSTPDPDKSTKPEPTKSPAKDNCTYVVTKSSNIRKSARGKRVGEVIKSGTKVTVTGKEENGWLEISAPESGWVWKSRTKKTCPPSKKADSNKGKDAKNKDD